MIPVKLYFMYADRIWEDQGIYLRDRANSSQIRNDEETATSATVLVATGDKFESANAAVMYQARNLILTSKKNTGEYDKEMIALREGVRPEWYENWYDGLGYCK